MGPMGARRERRLMTYQILANTNRQVLDEIAAFVKRAADAERHHAEILHKGKKIATERSLYAANCLDQIAKDIGEQMEIVQPGEDNGAWLPIAEAPIKEGYEALVWDGFGVIAAFYSEPASLEDWWDDVGDEGEPPDLEGYAEYVKETPHGWVALNTVGITYIKPILFQPIPEAPAGAVG